jgi:integrase
LWFFVVFLGVKWRKKSMAAKSKPDYPRTIVFGGARLRMRKRGDDLFDLVWREKGGTRKTTKAGEAKALEWAAKKVRELDAGKSSQWVHEGDGEALEALRLLAGEGDGAMRRLLDDVRGARHWLDGAADLTTAARWYAENGPLKVQRARVSEAIARFLGEYRSAPAATQRTFGTELNSFLLAPGHAEMMLLDLTEGKLSAWVSRKVGNEPPAPRTLRNRITTWVTFLNRARDWKLLPATGKHAGDLLRKPVIPDAGKEILTVDQGRRLLAAVREHEPKLEPYLLIAGWLGLRPSEIQRLTWEGFEWERKYLHVSTVVAKKTSTERYVPIDGRLLPALRSIYEKNGRKNKAKVCGFRSREFLSVLAREQGILSVWPPDVLRHSFCSYRIAVLQSLDRVAEEAGNSPKILKSNYRKPLRATDGGEWWKLLDADG